MNFEGYDVMMRDEGAEERHSDIRITVYKGSLLILAAVLSET